MMHTLIRKAFQNFFDDNPDISPAYVYQRWTGDQSAPLHTTHVLASIVLSHYTPLPPSFPLFPGSTHTLTIPDPDLHRIRQTQPVTQPPHVKCQIISELRTTSRLFISRTDNNDAWEIIGTAVQYTPGSPWQCLCCNTLTILPADTTIPEMSRCMSVWYYG